MKEPLVRSGFKKSFRHVNRMIDAIKANHKTVLRWFDGCSKKKKESKVQLNQSSWFQRVVTNNQKQPYSLINMYLRRSPCSFTQVGVPPKWTKEKYKEAKKEYSYPTLRQKYCTSLFPSSSISYTKSLVGKMTPVFLAQNCPTMVQSKKRDHSHTFILSKCIHTLQSHLLWAEIKRQ